MTKISDTAKQLLITMLILTVCAFVIGLFFISRLNISAFSYGLGLLVGFLFSALKLILTERSLNKSVEMDKQNAQSYARAQYMARYFLTLLVLVGAALIKSISLLGAIIGVLIVQPAAFIVGIMENRRKSK